MEPSKQSHLSPTPSTDQEFCLHYQYHFGFFFLIFWFFYCSWLSHYTSFYFISTTTIFSLLFSIIHVFLAWKVFEYVTRLILYFQSLRSRFQRILHQYYYLLSLSGISYLLLIIISHHRDFLRQCFSLVD